MYFNEDQKEYTVAMVDKYKDEANSASRRAFWNIVATNACIVLIGAAAILSKHDIIPEDIAIGAQTLSGVLGANFLIGSINNSTERSVAKDRATELLYGKNMDKLEDLSGCKHLKK